MPKSTKEAEKATRISKKLLRGRHGKTVKVHNKPHFYKPKTLKLSRRPRYERALPASGVALLDKFSIIRAPLASDAAMQKIESHNTLVFLCDVRANKTQIKKAVTERWGVAVEKVNTLIRPDGQKKAYVRLSKDHDALDMANKIGIV
ncbi:hypothetical protein FNF27_03172 [Cafeteria roenbergensis]|uniref:Large ribosomal subunit protein uL23 N-terminal domain-containing protein n=1 Tax=Cafeteria roenbergensis TaxID=33653 RepID=A0A5A8DWW8_CAFRO|nr:hypothetical protein FNF29_06831 [Cafeteria roenbergensis]KAA0162311.1 hypothetical protein FNF31_03353 [Cafeteria roenbergensis]KAA0169729.1 hypothetical protein FNF28_01848 [Cafeteria roenbergensis]KAA0175472.1 hypothetical protein FNF27_03172 [Cafeteria roenbergensis]|eukprot:KAA0148172.1 hypothetical protein FNF29_06831 [Cafeteria roenbergensis]